RYGPLPIWIYQAILAVTHRPVSIMVVRISVMSVATVLSLMWLRRSLRLWRWGWAPLAMAPYGWIYARQLWDNSFNIPLSIACLAAYAAFVARPRTWALMLAVFLAGLMLLVHLMAAPLIIAIGLHLLIFRRRDVISRWQSILIALAAVALLGLWYWPILWAHEQSP